MEKIHIQTESKQYNVFVGEGVRKDLESFISNHFPKLTRILIMTDETVAKLHLDKLLTILDSWDPIV